MIVGVGLALDVPGRDGAVDETDDTVVSQEEMICRVPDGGCSAWMSADGEEQLMLGGGDPSLEGVLLTPVEKAPQAVAEHEQLLVVRIRQVTRHLVLR